MSRPNDTAHQLQWGFASGGQNPDDTCPKGGMQVKNRIVAKMGEGVLDEHLAFSNCVVPIGHQNVICPVLDAGQSMLTEQMPGLPGTNHSVVLGMVPQTRDPDGATPGNNIFRHLDKKYEEGAGTKTPPTIKQIVGKDGASIFEMIEKNIEHSLSLLNGLSSTGAQWAIAGLKEDAVQQISTALDAFQNILTTDILSQLPGQVFQMSNLLNEMPQKLQDEMFKNMPANVQAGMKNAFQMMQTSIPSNLGGMMSAGRINPEVFFQNVVNEMKDVKTSGEMMSKLQQINGNDLLKGMDQFQDALVEIEGAFGNIFQKISTDATGKITVALEIPEAIANLQKSFQSLLTQLPGAGGVLGGAFKSANLDQIFSKFPPDIQKKFKDQMSKNVNPGTTPRKLLEEGRKALGNLTF